VSLFEEFRLDEMVVSLGLAMMNFAACILSRVQSEHAYQRISRESFPTPVSHTLPPSKSPATDVEPASVDVSASEIGSVGASAMPMISMLKIR
jgi:hypothetical protein